MVTGQCLTLEVFTKEVREKEGLTEKKKKMLQTFDLSKHISISDLAQVTRPSMHA